MSMKQEHGYWIWYDMDTVIQQILKKIGYGYDMDGKIIYKYS